MKTFPSVEKHFELLLFIEETYRKGDYNRCIDFCKQDIQLFPIFLKEWIQSEKAMYTNFDGTIDPDFDKDKVEIPFIPSFLTLAKIFQKQKLYDEAIQVCELAISYGLHDGTKGDFPARIQRLKKKQATPQATKKMKSFKGENHSIKLAQVHTAVNSNVDLEGLDWYVSVSFGNSTSKNFPKALYLAKDSHKYIETEYEGKKIYQAIFSENPQEFLKFIQLWELVKTWRSAFFAINGELVDKKTMGGIVYCYGDCCRSGNPDFCYGASYMTKNRFGCHRLQISSCNNPWWSFSEKIGNEMVINKEAIRERASQYGFTYKLCPKFNYDEIMSRINDLPEVLPMRAFNVLCQQEDGNLENEDENTEQSEVTITKPFITFCVLFTVAAGMLLIAFSLISPFWWFPTIILLAFAIFFIVFLVKQRNQSE